MYRKTIVYDRKSKDFAMYLNGELVGYQPTYLQAEATLNQLVYELLASKVVPSCIEAATPSDTPSPADPPSSSTDEPASEPQGADSGAA